MTNKIIVLIFAFFPALALAQTSGRFNSKDPIEITSDTLEVQQLENKATFTGNVVAIQSDTRLKSDKMIVYYTSPEEKKPDEKTKEIAKADATPAAQSTTKQTVKKIDVEGNVFLTTPEETASGDRGTYDVEGETIHLFDNVILTRGQNTLKGRELVYDFASGKSVISGGAVAESGASKGKERVRALFVPENKDGTAKTPKPANEEKKP